MKESKIAVVLGSRREEQQLRDVIKVDSRLELSEQLRESCLLQPKELNVSEEVLEISNDFKDFTIIVNNINTLEIEDTTEYAYNSEGSLLLPSEEIANTIDACKELIEPENGPILIPDKQDEIETLKYTVKVLSQNVSELTNLVKELIQNRNGNKERD